MSHLELGLQLQKPYLGQKSKGDTSEIMSALLQFSNVRFAVIQLSSAKGSRERLVLAYPNEETLRSLIADTSIVGLGFSSRGEAACAAGTAVTTGATPCQRAVDAAPHRRFRSIKLCDISLTGGNQLGTPGHAICDHNFLSFFLR